MSTMSFQRPCSFVTARHQQGQNDDMAAHRSLAILKDRLEQNANNLPKSVRPYPVYQTANFCRSTHTIMPSTRRRPLVVWARAFAAYGSTMFEPSSWGL